MAQNPLNCLRNLQAMGAAVSVDDFGVGFSNLSLLTRFRFDEVKLDRSLVQGLDRDDAGARASTSICRAVGQMGRELGMRVVAEGIETQGQHDAAAELGCAWAQGYLYARPMPAAAFEARWLRADAELLQGALSD